MSDELDEVDRIFVADMALAERSPDHEPFGMVEIARFLTEPEIELSITQSRKLFSDEALRQGYRQLKQALTFHELPAVVAASDGEVDERKFDGGRIDIIAGERAGEWYLRVEISGGAMPEKPLLLVESTQGRICKLPLTNPDSTNAFLILLDADDEEQGALLAVLRDPLSTGSILSAR